MAHLRTPEASLLEALNNSKSMISLGCAHHQVFRSILFIMYFQEIVNPYPALFSGNFVSHSMCSQGFVHYYHAQGTVYYYHATFSGNPVHIIESSYAVLHFLYYITTHVVASYTVNGPIWNCKLLDLSILCVRFNNSNDGV